MKRICTILLLLLVILLVGCESKPVKTEYTLNETAEIDDLQIELKSAKKTEDILEYVFEITNNRGENITLYPDSSFKFYDNDIQIMNKYQGNNIILKDGETTNYTLQYSIHDEDVYNVYFYSGVVENNIKFFVYDMKLEKQ